MKLLLALAFSSFLSANAADSVSAEHEMIMKPNQVVKDTTSVCVITSGEAVQAYSYLYKDKMYSFCCPACLDKFKSDPSRYISKVKEIKLEAFKYGYSPDPITVKKDDIVSLMLTSRDVKHGVYIKEYGIKTDIKKGQYKKIEFIADKVGTFDIICSVYCGSGHSKMRGKLIVEE